MNSYYCYIWVAPGDQWRPSRADVSISSFTSIWYRYNSWCGDTASPVDRCCYLKTVARIFDSHMTTIRLVDSYATFVGTQFLFWIKRMISVVRIPCAWFKLCFIQCARHYESHGWIWDTVWLSWNLEWTIFAACCITNLIKFCVQKFLKIAESI